MMVHWAPLTPNSPKPNVRRTAHRVRARSAGPRDSLRRYGIRSNRIAPTLTRLGALIAALLAVAPTNGPVAFDVMIRGPDGTEAWRRLGRGAIAAALMVLRLEPGKAHEFSLRWAEVDDAGSPVPPGDTRCAAWCPLTGGTG